MVLTRRVVAMEGSRDPNDMRWMDLLSGEELESAFADTSEADLAFLGYIMGVRKA